ncbi:MAG: hypothetical protein HYV13_02825 [Candidatus Doudnabacteria bacterium]|nr:hypothetical protein [Candidatus Doudnabacteria bacterium]
MDYQALSESQKRFRIFLGASAFILFLSSQGAFAHGLVYTLEKVEDDYLIDVGLSGENITAGDAVRISFELFDNKTKNPAEFDAVWVKLAQADKVMFIGTLQNDSSGLLRPMTYHFPYGGDYDLTVRYEKDNKKLAETVFNLKASDANQSSRFALMSGVVGLILGFLSAWFVKK